MAQVPYETQIQNGETMNGLVVRRDTDKYAQEWEAVTRLNGLCLEDQVRELTQLLETLTKAFLETSGKDFLQFPPGTNAQSDRVFLNTSERVKLDERELESSIQEAAAARENWPWLRGSYEMYVEEDKLGRRSRHWKYRGDFDQEFKQMLIKHTCPESFKALCPEARMDSRWWTEGVKPRRWWER